MWKKIKTRALPETPRVYPNGIGLKTSEGVYLLRDNKRYRFPTPRILDSWALPLIVETTEDALVNYPVKAKIGFRDGSLIHNLNDGKLYLISQNKRRHIASTYGLELLGIDPADAVRVSDYEVTLQEVGEPIGI